VPNVIVEELPVTDIVKVEPTGVRPKLVLCAKAAEAKSIKPAIAVIILFTSLPPGSE
jgi:hypothetical protein